MQKDTSNQMHYETFSNKHDIKREVHRRKTSKRHMGQLRICNSNSDGVSFMSKHDTHISTLNIEIILYPVQHYASVMSLQEP